MKTEGNNIFLNLANITTLIRVILIPPFLILVVIGRVFESFLIFLIAGITDVLDGQFARRLHQETKIGAMLDPAADKLLMTSAFIILSLPSLNANTLNTIPIWLTIIVIGRDILMVLGYIILSKIRGPVTIIPSLFGKTSTVFQVGTILLVLLLNYLQQSPSYLTWLYILTASFTLLAGIHYCITYTFRPPATVRR